MANRNVFSMVGGLRPKRNAFDLSYRKCFTCDLGQLIPVMCDEVVPGDHFKIGNEVTIRFQPLAAPIMHEITATVHYFFVPYRLIWEPWESFISSSLDAAGAPPIPLPVFPVMDGDPGLRDQYTLWDYFGFPIRQTSAGNVYPIKSPIMFPWYSYNLIYNEYYRDENLQSPVGERNIAVLNRNWRKDYFTSSLPFRQKGLAPALPVHLDFSRLSPTLWSNLQAFNPSGGAVYSFANPRIVGAPVDQFSVGTSIAIPSGSHLGVNVKDIGDKIANAAVASTFNVSDLRLSFQLQKWLERNARGGTRYTEFLRAHFGVSPSDARLDRPEYIGGTKQSVIISEVLQTSQTTIDNDNPANSSMLAQMGGHGLSAQGQYAGSYNVQEFGLIMGILSVMPKPAYQDGINRQWLRRLPTDFYFPEFCRLSEQGIYQSEIYFGFGYDNDDRVFGFTGQYDEMRVKNDIVCGDMRKINPSKPLLSYWNMARKFLGPPNLNTEFITCVPTKDPFLNQRIQSLIVNVRNVIMGVRPMPLIADPGLVDHY